MRNIQLGEKTYFENLDGLRFIFAAMVFLSHFVVMLQAFDICYVAENIQFKELGAVSVTAFFVLSGFLITFILLSEKERTKDINYVSFIKKRVLRIWPLYFLMIVVVYFVLNQIPIFHIFYNPNDNPYLSSYHLHDRISKPTEILLMFLFLPQLLTSLSEMYPLTQAWSIGVEEYFYLFWPRLMKKSRDIKRTILRILVIYMTMHLVLGISILVLQSIGIKSLAKLLTVFLHLLYMHRISCMAIGALGAYYFISGKVPQWLYYKSTQLVALTLVGIFLTIGYVLPFVGHEIYGILFIVIILNAIRQETCIFSLKHPILQQGGKVSYGFYMFHNYTIVSIIWFLKKLFPEVNGHTFALLSFIISFMLTFALAYFSYHYFERFFLEYKRKPIPSIQINPGVPEHY
ncbi:MAG: acyltransferase [Chitinophagales bacterium]|nr:acyltransferase [Chitinophagales bacterium]